MKKYLDSVEQTQSKEIPYPTDRLVVFDDGVTALLFEKEGDIIEWDHKYAQPMISTMDRVIVFSESGNEYVMGAGYIINSRDRVATVIDQLPNGIPSVTIGKNWEVPGFYHTTKIKAVMFRYKMATEQMMNNSIGENPFTDAEKLIKLAEKSSK